MLHVEVLLWAQRGFISLTCRASSDSGVSAETTAVPRENDLLCWSGTTPDRGRLKHCRCALPPTAAFATVRGIIYPSGEYWLDGFSWCRARSRSHLNCQELRRPAHQGRLRQGAPTNYLGRTTEPAAGLRRREGSRLLQCWYTRNCRQQLIEWRRRRTMQMRPQDRAHLTFEAETETCCTPSSSRRMHLHLVRSR